MRYIQALKENKYDFSSLPKDILKATKLVLKSKNYNSKIESLDLITFNSIRNSQPVDVRIEDLYKLSKNDNPVEENNGFNTPASIDEVEEEFASGGHIAEKTDDNKVRQTKVRFHLGKGENFMKWKVENPKTKDVEFFNPDDVQLEMYNCKLTNSPKTAMKIFTGEIDKSPIAWVVCEDVDVSSVVEPVDPEERLSFNPRTAPNWLDSDGDIVDNYVFEKLVTFGRGVYYEAPDGKLFALGGMAEESSIEEMASGKKIDENTSKVKLATINKIKKLTDRILQIQQYNLGIEDDFRSYNGNISWRERSKLFAEQSKLEDQLNEICNTLSQSQCLSIDYQPFQNLNTAGDYGYEEEDNYETGGEVQKTSPDIYENNLLQIRVIGGDYAYYTKINQEWKFLSESIVFKLKDGAKHELEHIGTIQAFKRKDIPNEIVATFIAYDHINEDINYYSKLDKAIPEQMASGKKLDSKTYTYALTIRPFDIGTYPKQNFIRVVEEAPEYKYGLLEYSEPLDDTAIQHYSLAPVSEILQFDGTTLDYYEGNFAKVKIERDSYNTPTLIVDFYDKEINEKTHSTEFTGKQFREKINSGDWKIINPLPSVTDPTNEPKTNPMANAKKIQTDSLRHAIENTISAGSLSVDTTFSKYEDIDALRSEMLRILRNEEGENPYTTPYSFEEFDILKKVSYTHLIKDSQKKSKNIPISEPNPELKNETNIIEKTNEKPMENILDSYSGSASNWNNVPVRWRNIKAVRPVTFSINPYDKGLLSIVDVFTGDDDLRPIMSAIHFEDKGLVCTDAHKLLHLHFNHSDFKGNYPSLNSAKAFGKETSKAEQEKQLNEGKFPNWEAVIPRDSEFTYEIDTMKLYQYCKVAKNYSNKTTHQVSFKYDKSNQIGFNVQFMIESLEAMMKIQKCPKVYIHISSPARASILSFTKSITPTSSTYCLLMPVMLNSAYSDDKPKQIYGAFDIDYNKSLSCYFDFTDSEIHNADTTIADYKESYGDSNEMPLELITLMDKFIKTAKSGFAKSGIPILENICVDGNGIRVDSIDSRIEIANDWKIPQGLYTIDNNALIRNDFNSDFEDYPKLENRVSLKEPLFTMDSDVFKFYIDKAFINVGKDELREALTGFAIEHSQGSNLSLISTDSYVVFHANLLKYAKNIKKENFKFIAGEVKQLVNFAKNIESKEISFYSDEYANEGKYRISAGRLHFEAKQIYAKYPNWEGIVPREFSNQISFNIKDLYVCMNNEVSKSFAKKEGLKPLDLGIYNQGDKIFLSNQPDPKNPNNLISKEICEMKIERVIFPEPKAFNIYQNFVLLMPLSYTNGDYFNFGVEPINRVIATIGKEKVIAEYTELNRSYLFTSDNLDFNTSDVYKPVKEKKTPSNKNFTTSESWEKQPSWSKRNPSDFETGDLIINNKTQVQYKVKTPKTKDNFSELIVLNDTYKNTGEIEKWANNEQTKVFGLVVGIWLQKSKEAKLEQKEKSKVKSKYPIQPTPIKEDKPANPSSTKIQKETGKNPSEFNVGDLIEYAGVLYEVKVPKTKDNFSKLINWSDYYRTGDIDEFANTEHTKVFKLVKKKSNKDTFEVIKDVESLSPAFDTISAYTREIYKYESKEMNTEPLQDQIIKVLNLKAELLKFLKTKEIQENIIWTNDIQEVLQFEKNLVDRLEKNYSPSSSLKKKEKEDKELADALRGLEALMKISKNKNDKDQIEQAVYGLKALLK